MNYSRNRSDQEWLESITGMLGADEQTAALRELANYTFVIAVNNLARRQGTLASLKFLTEDELSAIAEGLVQDFMLKLFTDDFALLEKYSGYGSFLGWVAQVVNNLCNSEMRRTCWRRSEPLTETHMSLPSSGPSPEQTVLGQSIRDALTRCLDKLPERYRYALVECVLEGKSASEVGTVLEVSANAVYLLVHRAKKMMRRYLEHEGLGSDVLSILSF